LGSLVIDASGNWSYEVDNSLVQYLKAGETRDEVFTVTSADGTPHTVTVTVTGANETATVGSGTVQEDTTVSTGGTLTATGGASFIADSQSGSYGTLQLGTNGQWTYTLDNASPAVQALVSGETRTESFTVQLNDGSSTTVTVQVQGLNDGAVIAGDASGAVIEDINVTAGGKLIDSGSLTVADADAGQTSFTAGAGTPV
ncbi:VCBS domain-containing protein, partial [Chitinolyticbacter albus]|uniref:VCBS domain-containing protein n=1 Tax=Chitinolyticbacter albus TaxID=2961951 RepID=UPI00210B10A5